MTPRSGKAKQRGRRLYRRHSDSSELEDIPGNDDLVDTDVEYTSDDDASSWSRSHSRRDTTERNRHRHKQSSDSDESSSSEECEVHLRAPQKVKKRAKGGNHGVRRKGAYTDEEDSIILKYLIKHEKIPQVFTGKMWQKLAKKGIVNRSANSLRDHFRKVLSHRWQKFVADVPTRKKFAKVVGHGLDERPLNAGADVRRIMEPIPLIRTCATRREEPASRGGRILNGDTENTDAQDEDQRKRDRRQDIRSPEEQRVDGRPPSQCEDTENPRVFILRGKSLGFNIDTTASEELEQIGHLILDHGGHIDQQATLCLGRPGDRAPSGCPLYNVQYIRDCIAANKILPYNAYLLTPLRESSRGAGSRRGQRPRLQHRKHAALNTRAKEPINVIILISSEDELEAKVPVPSVDDSKSDVDHTDSDIEQKDDTGSQSNREEDQEADRLSSLEMTTVVNRNDDLDENRSSATLCLRRDVKSPDSVMHRYRTPPVSSEENSSELTPMKVGLSVRQFRVQGERILRDLDLPTSTSESTDCRVNTPVEWGPGERRSSDAVEPTTPPTSRSTNGRTALEMPMDTSNCNQSPINAEASGGSSFHSCADVSTSDEVVPETPEKSFPGTLNNFTLRVQRLSHAERGVRQKLAVDSPSEKMVPAEETTSQYAPAELSKIHDLHQTINGDLQDTKLFDLLTETESTANHRPARRAKQIQPSTTESDDDVIIIDDEAVPSTSDGLPGLQLQRGQHTHIELSERRRHATKKQAARKVNGQINKEKRMQPTVVSSDDSGSDQPSKRMTRLQTNRLKYPRIA